MNLESEFKFWKILFLVTIELIVCLGFGYFLLFTAVPKAVVSKIVASIFGCLMFSGAIFLVYAYILQFKRIKISGDGVLIKSLFKTETFAWADVQRVKYYVKSMGITMIPFSFYYTEVVLKDKRTVQICFDYYSNGHIILQYIEHYFKKKSSAIVLKEDIVRNIDIVAKSFMSFKGTPLLSFRCLQMWTALFFILVFVILAPINRNMSIFVSVAAGAYLLVCALSCFYIKISDDYLVMRNYFLPFMMKSYRLSDVRQLTIERIELRTSCLRVVSKSFQYWVFPCATLGGDEWKEFTDVMAEKGFKVRDGR